MVAIAKKFWRYIGNINGLLLIFYCVFIFMLSAMISNHFSLYYIAVTLLLSTLLSVFVCHWILLKLSGVSLTARQTHFSTQKTKVNALQIVLCLIPFFVLVLCFWVYYPGGFTTDSLQQYEQAVTGEYNDWHPVIQTLLTFKLPLALTGGWIGSIVLFQTLCFSAVLSYFLRTIYIHTNTKYTICSALFVLANPKLCWIALFPWKDTTFTICTLLLVTFSLEIYLSKGVWIKKPLPMISFIVVASLTTLVRHNALLFTIPLLIAVSLFVSKKRAFAILLSVIVLCLGVKYPLYTALNVEKPDQRQVETLGLPMTVIGAVVTYDPDSLDAETKDFAYKVAAKEVWEENYQYGSSYNSLKWSDGTDNNVIEEYGAKKVVLMMFRCMKNSSIVSIRALIKLTEASFTVSDPHETGFQYPDTAEYFQLEVNRPIAVKELVSSCCHFMNDTFPHLFMYLGVMHLLLIVSILSKCRLNRWKDWKKILFVLPVFSYNLGTTLLLTGIGDTKRFFFYTFPLMPMLLIFLFKKDEGGTDETVRETI